MKNNIKQIAALAVLASASLAASAQSVNFTVTGQVVPAACALSMAGGNAFAFGAHSTNTLSGYPVSTLYGTPHAVLPATSSKFLNIACDAPSKVKLTAVDNNSASSVGLGYFGLGLIGAQNIGGFALAWNSVTVDGTPQASGLHSDDSGVTWTRAGFPLAWIPGREVSPITTAASVLPDAFTTASLEIAGRAFVNKTLPMTSTVNLSGSGTITLTYL